MLTFFEDQLSNAVAGVDDKGLGAVVKQYDADVAGVVGVDNACANTDVRLDSETRARSDAAIYAFRHRDGDIGVDEAFSIRFNRARLSTRQVVSGC